MRLIYLLLLLCMDALFGQQPGDIIINEILFNPRPGGADFIEIYNHSNNNVDLKTLFIAGRNANGQVTGSTAISKSQKWLSPKTYCLLTADSLSIILNHHTRDPAAITEVSKMPSMPDDKGKLLLLNAGGVIIDELHYDEDWHFALLNDKEGVSLERLSAEDSTQKAGNWHSAASTAGFATPGYDNSQLYFSDHTAGKFKLEPEIFSPDNNGIDDFAVINYQFSEPGYVASISVFNMAGRPVAMVARNQLCGVKGFFRWDGLDDSKKPLASGVYVVLIECLNLKGQRLRAKKALTLVRPY